MRLAYVDQSRDSLDPSKNVWEEISGGAEQLQLGTRQMASRAYVASFNFKGSDQQKKVGDLSGGERNRVHLATLLKSGGNLLLLDEPTNDLDVDTLRALEDALLSFAGCAVVISHDRWFLNRVATHMLAFEGDSGVVWFEGNYEDYEADRHKRLALGGRHAAPHPLQAAHARLAAGEDRAMFKDTVTSREELRAIFGAPMERAVLKERPSLDVHSRAFIASAPFVLIATSGAAGRCDVSPKGDAPGFVLVLDDHHLVVPDRPGNNRIDGFTNIVENPHVGMIFLIPGREDTLRVNGRAAIVRDAEILDRLEVQGKRPKVAIGVEVEECFLHCAKAFKRSGLWERERWPDVAGLPSMARMLWEQIGAKPIGHACVEDYERDQQERLRKTLY